MMIYRLRYINVLLYLPQLLRSQYAAASALFTRGAGSIRADRSPSRLTDAIRRSFVWYVGDAGLGRERGLFHSTSRSWQRPGPSIYKSPRVFATPTVMGWGDGLRSRARGVRRLRFKASGRLEKSVLSFHAVKDGFECLDASFHIVKDGMEQLDASFHAAKDVMERLDASFHAAKDGFECLDASFLAVKAGMERLDASFQDMEPVV